MGFGSSPKAVAQKPIKSNSFSNNQTKSSFSQQKKENSQENQYKIPTHLSEFNLTPQNRGKRPKKIPRSKSFKPNQQIYPENSQNQIKEQNNKPQKPNKNQNKPQHLGKPPPIPKTQQHLSPKKSADLIRPIPRQNTSIHEEQSYSIGKTYKKQHYDEQSFSNYVVSPRKPTNRIRNKTPKPINHYDNEFLEEKPNRRRKSPTIRSKSVYSLEQQSYNQDERRMIAKKLRNVEKNISNYLDMKLNILKDDFLHTFEQKLKLNSIVEDMIDIFCDEIKSQIEDEMTYFSLNTKTKKKNTQIKLIDLETILLPYDNQFIALFNKTAQVTHIKKLFDDNKNILKAKSQLISYKEFIPSIFDQHIKDLKTFQEEISMIKEHSKETEEQSQLKYKIRRLKLKSVFWESYLNAKEKECEYYENRIKHYNELSINSSETLNKQNDIHEHDFNIDLRDLIDTLDESLEKEMERRSSIHHLETITNLNDDYEETSLKLSNIHNIICNLLQNPNKDETNTDDESKVAKLVQEKLETMQNQRKTNLEQVTTLLDTLKPYTISTIIPSEDELG